MCDGQTVAVFLYAVCRLRRGRVGAVFNRRAHLDQNRFEIGLALAVEAMLMRLKRRDPVLDFPSDFAVRKHPDRRRFYHRDSGLLELLDRTRPEPIAA